MGGSDPVRAFSAIPALSVPQRTICRGEIPDCPSSTRPLGLRATAHMPGPPDMMDAKPCGGCGVIRLPVMGGLMFEGKVALVTGGCRGIGTAITECLAEAGAHVAAGYNRDKDTAEALATRLRSQGGSVSVHQGNVAEPESCSAHACPVPGPSTSPSRSPSPDRSTSAIRSRLAPRSSSAWSSGGACV